MSVQEDLVRRLQASESDFENAVANLTEAQSEMIWSGAWGVKHIVAHIAGWQSTMAQALEKIARGERPVVDGVDLTDTDGNNARFAKGAEALPLDSVLASLGASTDQLAAAIRSLPDDRIDEGRTARRIAETMIGHPSEHAAEIRAWWQQQGV